MKDKKPCARCERLIDPWARICPFCNWEQEVPPPKESPLASAAGEEAVDPATEDKRQLRRRILTAIGIAALLLLTFAIGSFIARLGRKPMTPEEETPSSVQAPSRTSAQRLTDLRLVQVDPSSTIGRSVTSVPQQLGAPTNTVGNDADATALPSQQYAELVRRSAKQQATDAGGADTLDPRTIVAPPIPQIRRPAPAPRPPAPEPGEAIGPTGDADARRTLPEPIFQPLPDIDASGTAKFRLRIGADGAVKEVDVIQALPGATPRLIAAIQRWKFKPATLNGRPVEGVHLVDISFKGQDD
ncbi:MAG TPA: energy transducer TonB [Thermoanaerobaculia bacterium]